MAVSTVSHALNGTAPISREVRDRIIEIARRMGYLDQRRIKASIATLSVIVLAMPRDAAREVDTNLFTFGILNGLRRECDRRSIRVVASVSETNEIDTAAVREAVRTEGARGVVLMSDDRPEALKQFSDIGVPVVVINGEDPTMSVDTVLPANRYGARLAVEHLLSLGHRNILHMTWPGRATIRRRVDGFRDALRGVEGIGEPRILEVPSFEPEHAEAAIDRLVASGVGLGGATAVFCAADNLALGVLRALARHGIRVPQDVSVMGFDDTLLGELSQPPLTTIHVPVEQLGPTALRLIEQRLLANDPAMPAFRVELGCRLTLRGTIAPPAAG